MKITWFIWLLEIRRTQLSEVKKLGKPVIQLDIYGNKI